MSGNKSMAAAFMNAAEEHEERPPIEYEKKLSRTLSNQSGMGSLDTEWQKEQEEASRPERSLSRTLSKRDGIGGTEQNEGPGPQAPERQLSRTLSNQLANDGVGGLDEESGAKLANRQLSRTVSKRDEVGGVE